jgi:hypothetical protein
MTGMDVSGLGVTPGMLSGAAAEIEAVLRGSGVAAAAMPAGGAGYGHAGVSDAVARFGSVVGAATESLMAGAEAASTGLRAGASAYLAQEQAALRAVGVASQRHGA